MYFTNRIMHHIQHARTYHTAFADGLAHGDREAALERGRGAAAPVARRGLVHQVGRRGGRHGEGTDQGNMGCIHSETVFVEPRWPLGLLKSIILIQRKESNNCWANTTPRSFEISTWGDPPWLRSIQAQNLTQWFRAKLVDNIGLFRNVEPLFVIVDGCKLWCWDTCPPWSLHLPRRPLPPRGLPLPQGPIPPQGPPHPRLCPCPGVFPCPGVPSCPWVRPCPVVRPCPRVLSLLWRPSLKRGSLPTQPDECIHTFCCRPIPGDYKGAEPPYGVNVCPEFSVLLGTFSDETSIMNICLFLSRECSSLNKIEFAITFGHCPPYSFFRFSVS